MRLIQNSFEIAKAQLNKNWKEVSGPKSNPLILEIYKSVDGLDNLELNDDEIPWCSCWVNWCIQKAGGKGTRNAMARSWLNWGNKSSGEVGDIVILTRGNSKVQGHVGFLYKKGLIYVEVLGGNQTNNVTVQKYLRTKVLGYRTSKDLTAVIPQTKKEIVNMDLVSLLNNLVANIASLQAQLADAQKAADDLAKAKYDEGFAAGVASVQPSDKIYSQAEVDAIVLPLNEKIAALELAITDINATIPAKIAEAVAAFKAELLAKYEEQQVVETQAETGFKNLLV